MNHGRSTLLNNFLFSSGQNFANIIAHSFFHFPSSNILFSIVSIKMVVVFPSQYFTYKKLTRFIEVVEHLSAPLWWNVIKSKYKSAKVWVHKLKKKYFQCPLDYLINKHCSKQVITKQHNIRRVNCFQQQ